VRILIRATNWVGDAVMSLPALRAARARHPEAHIAVLARPWVADLYARETFADRVIPYPHRGAAQKLAAARTLRRERFDCALLLQNAFEAALVARLARIPRRIGYDRDARGWLLTERARPPRPGEIPEHESFYYLELLRRTGWIEKLPDEVVIRLDGRDAAAAAGRARFARQGLGERVVGVSPGAAYGGAKRWPPERFAEAALLVARERDASVAVFGTRQESAVCGEVVARLADSGCRARSFAGLTRLAGFIEAAAACDVFLTNDSGAMHIASAAGTPTVAVFGATNDRTTGPTGPSARVVREPVECSPCLLRECPIDHRCMTRVGARRVAEAALDLLK
jgi:heptosyltransferase-2